MSLKNWFKAEEKLSQDLYIGPLVEKYGHCTILPKKHKDYFADLCSAVIGQQLSGKVADVIFERFKNKIKVINPPNILKTKDQVLRDCGMSWAKVFCLKDLAVKTIEGKVKTKSLANLSDEEVKQELTVVKGIGNWAAEMFLMFTLARPDIFASDDLGIKNGVRKILSKELSKKELETFSERWKPFRTVASWYIWKNLDNR